MLSRSLRRAVAILLAVAGACFELDSPTDPERTRVVGVSVAADTLSADGTSRTTVTATLAEDTPSGIELTFLTDAGTLTGGGKGPAQEIKVNASDRTATLTLISGLRPGVATVTVRAESSFATDTVVFTPAVASEVELTTDVARARANGQDAVTVTARLRRLVGAGTVSEGTRVRFDVLRDGAPAPELSGTEETGTTGVATRRITTRVAGTYRVIGSAGGRADSVTVVFDPTPP